jgi:beta-phosphoglucomutase-like phosphatase (HAD superfamily)
LNIPPAEVIAVEDSPAGVRSARAAGAQVVAVTTTHPAELLGDANLVVDGLDELTGVLVGLTSVGSGLYEGVRNCSELFMTMVSPSR